jgi:signal recognition particle receptor subunit beta
MAFTNFDSKEINCKIAYFGPRSAGKSENLRAVFRGTSKELQAGLLELEENAGYSSHFFEFLPVSIGHVGQFHFKMHLYTLPLVGLYETVHSVLLKGLDGFIFVADSRIDAMPANIAAWEQAKALLASEGISFPDLPRVVQYNRRDDREALPIDVLRHELNPTNLPDQEAIAKEGKGTMETLHTMSKLVLKRLGEG